MTFSPVNTGVRATDDGSCDGEWETGGRGEFDEARAGGCRETEREYRVWSKEPNFKTAHKPLSGADIMTMVGGRPKHTPKLSPYLRCNLRPFLTFLRSVKSGRTGAPVDEISPPTMTVRPWAM